MNFSQPPKISVIMPVLNRGDMIEQAISSVINQDYPETELIILDGGSTDNTIDIIKKYEKYISYWHSQHDGSAPHATNIGIAKASGDLIALLMSDDYYEPGIFHAVANAYLANPDNDIYTCKGRMVNLHDKNIIEDYDSEKKLRLNFYNICYGTTGICLRFIRKSLHDRIGLYIPFDEANKQFLTNDKEFLLRALFNKVREKFVDHYGYTHVAHDGSFSFGSHRRSFVKHCTEHMIIAEMYLSRYPMTFRKKMFFRFWYHDQAAKLFLYYLVDGKYRNMLAAGWSGLKKNFLLWPAVFCITTANAIIKRCRLG